MPYSAPQEAATAPSVASIRQEFKTVASSGVISPPPTATASTRFKYVSIGAGAGAGSGRQGSPGTNRCGGSGGGPGGLTEGEYLLGDLMAIAGVTQPSDLRLSINIPEGGKGGLSVTTADTNGNNGNNPIGGNTSIELRNATGTFARIIATGANGQRGNGGGATGSSPGGTGGDGMVPLVYGGNGKSTTGDTPAQSVVSPSGGAGGSGLGTNNLPNTGSPGGTGAYLRHGAIAKGGLPHLDAIAHDIPGVPGGGGGGGESDLAIAANRRGGKGYRGGGGGGGAASTNGTPSGEGEGGGDGYVMLTWI